MYMFIKMAIEVEIQKTLWLGNLLIYLNYWSLQPLISLQICNPITINHTFNGDSWPKFPAFRGRAV